MFQALAITAGVAGVALAWLVYRASPQRKLNRVLSLVLAFEGTAWLFSAWEGFMSPDDRVRLVAVHAPILVSIVALFAFYLVMLATALDVPLVAPFRPRAVQFALVLAIVPASLYLLANPEGMYKFQEGVGNHGALFDLIFQGVGVLGLYALAAVLWAWRRAAPGTAARRRARMFALAFGCHDLSWASVGIVAPLVAGEHYANQFVQVGPAIVLGALSIVYLLLLAYGILREQLLDIDLKVKTGLRRSTVAATFVAAMFITSELVAAVLSERIGLVAGILAAGLLVFALAPLQRLAERVSDVAMPNVHDTNEYRLVRKHEVYRATVEGALMDGAISERERDMLATLQEQLDLKPTEARAIERDAVTVRARNLP